MSLFVRVLVLGTKCTDQITEGRYNVHGASEIAITDGRDGKSVAD